MDASVLRDKLLLAQEELHVDENTPCSTPPLGLLDNFLFKIGSVSSSLENSITKGIGPSEIEKPESQKERRRSSFSFFDTDSDIIMDAGEAGLGYVSPSFRRSASTSRVGDRAHDHGHGRDPNRSPKVRQEGQHRATASSGFKMPSINNGEQTENFWQSLPNLLLFESDSSIIIAGETGLGNVRGVKCPVHKTVAMID